MRVAIILGGLSALTQCAASTAQLTYLSQNRSISAQTNHIVGGGTVAAPDFGPFDTSISTPPDPVSGGLASAQQTSRLDPTSITISGNLLARRPAAAGSGIATASSFDALTFELDAPTDYTLSGHLPTGPPPPSGIPAGASVELSGPGIALSLPSSGSLPPGTYTLNVDIKAYDGAIPSIGGPYSYSGFISAFDVEFDVTSIPEPSSVPALILVPLGLVRRRRSNSAKLRADNCGTAGGV